MTIDEQQKISQIIKLLKFLSSLNDLEIIKSVMESIVETLSEIIEEENNSST